MMFIQLGLDTGVCPELIPLSLHFILPIHSGLQYHSDFIRNFSGNLSDFSSRNLITTWSLPRIHSAIASFHSAQPLRTPVVWYVLYIYSPILIRCILVRFPHHPFAQFRYRFTSLQSSILPSAVV